MIFVIVMESGFLGESLALKNLGILRFSSGCLFQSLIIFIPHRYLPDGRLESSMFVGVNNKRARTH
jgi:hypothetical protein